MDFWIDMLKKTKIFNIFQKYVKKNQNFRHIHKETLSSEIDTMLDEFGCEIDKRIANISNDDLWQTIQKLESELQEEFKENDKARAREFLKFKQDGDINLSLIRAKNENT